MEWLNYHHLLYFWVATREGSLSKAGRRLHVSQPSISHQIKQLENALGEKLFERVGRRLVLTETGQVVASYAGDVFSLGQEMLNTVRERPSGRPLRMSVGITDVMPKLVARMILEPIARLETPARMICIEHRVDELLTDLAAFRVDVVLSDRPVVTEGPVKVLNHLLGECGVSFLGSPAFARKLKRGFPRSLDKAPIYLPTDNTILRRSLDQWFEEEGIKPQVIGEFDDSALLQVFGQMGMAAFPVLELVEKEICRREEAKVIGRAKGVKERFYAILPERKIQKPAVLAMCAAARKTFGGT